MNKIGFSIQFFFLCCTISLSAQSIVSRIRVFPNLNYAHSAPVLSHDGNKLFFSVFMILVNVFPSFIPYKFKKSKLLKLLSFLVLPLLLPSFASSSIPPFVLFTDGSDFIEVAVVYRWHM